MLRDTIAFAEFKKHFIDHPEPDLYVPVEHFLEEDEETGDELRIMNVDLICHWRLRDAKVKFYAIPFDTEQQFQELIAYFRLINDRFRDHLLEQIDALTFPKEAS